MRRTTRDCAGELFSTNVDFGGSLLAHDLHGDEILDIDEAKRPPPTIKNRDFVDSPLSNELNGVAHERLTVKVFWPWGHHFSDGEFRSPLAPVD